MQSQPPSEAPLTCEDVRDVLYLLVTNELGEETDAVCLHLTGCKDCRVALAEHIRLAGRLTSAFKHIELHYYSSYN